MEATATSAISTGQRGRSVPGIVVLALAACVGIALARHRPEVPAILWLAMAGVPLSLAWWWHLRRHGRRGVLSFMALTTTLLAAAWVTLRHGHVTSTDPAGWMDDEQVLVHLRGRASGAPELKARTSGSMARFDYRPPGTYFPIIIDALIDRDGVVHAVHGRAYVRVDGAVAPFHIGDVIELRGYVLRPGPALNPGEFDFRLYARSLGQAGVIRVPDRELLTITEAARHPVSTAWLRWRDGARQRASGLLLADLPGGPRAEREALLLALLLGEREADLDSVNESFRRVGLAHLLAISGLHLGVLAALVVGLFSLLGVSRVWHGLLLILVVLVYLALVEVRLPVLRAGVMTMAGGAALLGRRRLRVGSLVALSAIALLIWRPDQLFNAGFQLSFGVVLGLIYFAPPVRERWFGKPDMEAPSTSALLMEWLKSVTAAALVAWMIATPISMYHFGIFSPLAAPLSVIVLPMVTLLLAVGYLKMLLGIVLPSGALLLGAPLSICADLLISLVESIDAMPLTTVRTPFPGVWWSLLAMCVVVVICARSGRGKRGWNRGSALAVILLALMLLAPGWLTSGRPALRADMLAVGDGSCYLLRSGGEAMLFDAGSSTDLDAGRRSILPALRRLGVRRLDCIAVSHANLDHYSAVLEVAEAMHVDRAFVTDSFVLEAESDPFGSDAYLLDGLTQLGVAVDTKGSGDTFTLGRATLRWVHPDPGLSFRRVNDTSMVIRTDVADCTLLLCGDIQAEAMAHLLDGQADLRAEVVELPHHGSHHEMAVEFMAAVDAQVVLQSTGWGRWQHDQWASKFNDVTRMITARDGACWVEIDPSGTIATGAFLSEPLLLRE